MVALKLKTKVKTAVKVGGTSQVEVEATHHIILRPTTNPRVKVRVRIKVRVRVRVRVRIRIRIRIRVRG